jgi:putative ABC transport system permease protein
MSRVKTALALLEKEWKILFPEKPFNYSFLDESISRLFEQEENTKWLMNSTMSITILISCMGLFGLGMFIAQKRTREIGIRKVLGATVANVTTLFSKDFVLLVLIAMTIATPVSWYFMHQWLQDFAYRTDRMVDLRTRRINCYLHCTHHDKFSGNSCGHAKPGKVIKD